MVQVDKDTVETIRKMRDNDRLTFIISFAEKQRPTGADLFKPEDFTTRTSMREIAIKRQKDYLKELRVPESKKALSELGMTQITGGDLFPTLIVDATKEQIIKASSLENIVRISVDKPLFNPWG